MWVSRLEEAEKVKDTVQVSDPLKLQNNARGMRSPLKMMNVRAAQRVNQAQGAANDAGVLITLSGARRGNLAPTVMSLSNLDVDLFAAD